MLLVGQKGCIPRTTTAEIACETAGVACKYRVAQGENPSPLRKIRYRDRQFCDLTFAGHWTLDLEAHALVGLDFIRSHGRDEVTPATATTGNAITHWYLQLHDRPILLVRHKLHRLPGEMEEGLYFYGEPVLAGRLIRVQGGEGVIVLHEGTEAISDGKRVRLRSDGWERQEVWCFGYLAGKIRRAVPATISLDPDPESPGAYLLKGESKRLSVEVRSGQELGDVEVTLCGAIQGRRKLYLSQGKGAFSLEIIPEQTGLLPLLSLIHI